MKRFWKEARAEGPHVLLDGKPVRTPKRNLIALPTDALVDAIAAEWNAVEETLDPRALPLTSLANAAIDIVAHDTHTFAASLAKYAETDLLAYRAADPAPLIARQAAEWNPLLDWARTRYDVHVEVVAGIMHRPQPEATLARLGEAIVARDPFELAALSPIVTIAGSLIIGLALAERAFGPDRTPWRQHISTNYGRKRFGRRHVRRPGPPGPPTRLGRGGAVFAIPSLGFSPQTTEPAFPAASCSATACVHHRRRGGRN